MMYIVPEHLLEGLIFNARRLGLTDADNPVCGTGQKLPHKMAIPAGKILMNKNDVHGSPKVHKKWEYSIGNILIFIYTKNRYGDFKEKEQLGIFILHFSFFVILLDIMRLDVVEGKALKYALGEFTGDVYLFGSRVNIEKAWWRH
jgi:hypothetical protein